MDTQEIPEMLLLQDGDEVICLVPFELDEIFGLDGRSL